MFLFVWEFQGVRVRLCFSFLAVISLTCLLGGNESGKILVMLGCCCLHECGHIAAMLICRCKPTVLTLYGGGIRLTPSRKLNSFAKDAFILASGCAVNFMLAFASCLLTGRLTFFAQTNLLLGGFNLIPTGFLDGGNIIYADKQSGICVGVTGTFKPRIFDRVEFIEKHLIPLV